MEKSFFVARFRSVFECLLSRDDGATSWDDILGRHLVNTFLVVRPHLLCGMDFPCLAYRYGMAMWGGSMGRSLETSVWGVAHGMGVTRYPVACAL